MNPQQPNLAHVFSGQGLQYVPAAGISQFGPAGFHGMAMGGGNVNSIGADQQRPNLSLWLNQGNHHQMNPLDMGANSGLYASSNISGFPEVVQMAQANAFGSSPLMSNFGMHSSNSTTSSLSLSSPHIGMPSSISESQKQQSKPAASPMSATALLQKAAQMGSTRSSSSNNPSMFSGSFGVMNSSSSSQTTSLSNNNNTSQNSNELNQAFQSLKQPENFTSTSSAGMMGNANFSSLRTSSNSFDQISMQTNGKQSEQSLTRDFLGVSGGSTGHHPQFLSQELAKFASIGSPMGLSQFTGNH